MEQKPLHLERNILEEKQTLARKESNTSGGVTNSGALWEHMSNMDRPDGMASNTIENSLGVIGTVYLLRNSE